MTTREVFVARILPAVMLLHKDATRDQLAEWAYAMADAAIAYGQAHPPNAPRIPDPGPVCCVPIQPEQGPV